MLTVAFPDLRIELTEMVAKGDKVLAYIAMRGTHAGEFQGIPPTGRPISMPGIAILRFAGGKCVERWSQTDFAGLLSTITTPPQSSG